MTPQMVNIKKALVNNAHSMKKIVFEQYYLQEYEFSNIVYLC